MTSNKKIISIPYEGYKDVNRDYWSYFIVIFETNGLIGPRRESESDINFILNSYCRPLIADRDF